MLSVLVILSEKIDTHYKKGLTSRLLLFFFLHVVQFVLCEFHC